MILTCLTHISVITIFMQVEFTNFLIRDQFYYCHISKVMLVYYKVELVPFVKVNEPYFYAAAAVVVSAAVVVVVL